MFETPRCEVGRRGFTLIEVMVATAIVGLVLVTVYGAVARTVASKNHAEERAELYAAGREAVLKMADEIEGALSPAGGRNVGFVGVPGTERVPTDAVQFDVVIRRLFGVSQGRGGRALVSYSLDPLKDRPNLFALRRQEQLLTDPAAEDIDASAGDVAEPAAPTAFAAYLLDQVAGLRFRYLDPESGEWTDAWDTTVPRAGVGPRGLPGAVEITLFLADPRGAIHDFGTIVDLPLANLVPTPRS